MPAMALNEVLQKIFFSRKQVKVPMLTSVVFCAVDVGIVYIMARLFGVAGIAAATGISITLCCGANYVIDARREGSLFSLSDALDILKCAVFACVCALSAHITYEWLMGLVNSLLALALSVAVAVAVYGILILLFPTAEIRALGIGKRGKK